jgi:hypothetical protein
MKNERFCDKIGAGAVDGDNPAFVQHFLQSGGVVADSVSVKHGIPPVAVIQRFFFHYSTWERKNQGYPAMEIIK